MMSKLSRHPSTATSSPTTEYAEKRIWTSSVFISIILLVFLVVTAICFLIFAPWFVISQPFQTVPKPIHAINVADYAPLTDPERFKPLEIAIVLAAINDLDPNFEPVPDRLTQIVDFLSTPLAEPVTPPMATPTPTRTLEPDTPIPSPSATSTAIHPVSPTNPALTNTFSPTDTPAPLTSTPTPEDMCSQIRLVQFSVGSNAAHWTLVNTSSEAAIITSIFLQWPSQNEQLKKIEINGRGIWHEGDSASPTVIDSDWTGNNNHRTIPAHASKELEFKFLNPAVVTGYMLSITLNNTCQITSAQ